jgi:hypothetical protein
MQYGFNWGIPQVIVGVCMLIGLFLVGRFLLGVIPGHGMSKEEKERYRHNNRRLPMQFRFISALGIVICVLLVTLLVFFITALGGFMNITAKMKVAHIEAIAFTNVPHQMAVTLTLYNQSSTTPVPMTYQLAGSEWRLQGDIVKPKDLLSVIGFQPGFKLTRLEGRFDDIQMENKAHHTAIPLNGGDEGFFQDVYNHTNWWEAWFVDAKYGNAVILGPGKYDVYLTNDALIAYSA